jgi:hypothetical protein
MEIPNFTSTGDAPRVVRVEALAFHDAAGNIRHMHHHVVLEGAAPRSIHDMLEEVKAHALALNNDVSELRVLHVSEPFNYSARHRVDVKRGVLVELSEPMRPLSASAPAPKKKSAKRKPAKKRSAKSRKAK